MAVAPGGRRRHPPRSRDGTIGGDGAGDGRAGRRAGGFVLDNSVGFDSYHEHCQIDSHRGDCSRPRRRPSTRMAANQNQFSASLGAKSAAQSSVKLPSAPGPVTPPSTANGAVNPSKYPRPARSSAQPPPASEPAVDQLVAEHFSRRAGAEAARTALALGLPSSQTDQFRDFLKRLYRERSDAGNDEDRARYRQDERRRIGEFLATIAGDAGAERYRALRDEREAAVLERVAGDALYEFARRIDLTEEQKQRLFEAFAVAARTDAESGRQSSLQVNLDMGWMPPRDSKPNRHHRMHPHTRTTRSLEIAWPAGPDAAAKRSASLPR